MKTNIAERSKSYYESEDFKNDYSFYLLESFTSNKSEVLNRIQSSFEDYYFEKKYGFSAYITRDEAKEIFNFILDNFDSFVDTFRNYYVGSCSLESVSFGEQEEQLTDIYNHNTGKDYSLPYLKKVFNQAGYYVNKQNYAYYDLSNEGLQVNLLTGDIPAELIEKIKTNHSI